MHFVFLIVYCLADLVSASHLLQHPNMEMVFLTRRELFQSLRPRKLGSHRLPGQSKYPQRTPTPNEPAAEKHPMPRFPSPTDKDGKPLPKEPGAYPRVDVEAMGPAKIATRTQSQEVPPNNLGGVHETHHSLAMVGGQSFGHASSPTADYAHLQHPLRAHAQGKSAKIDIHPPPGGIGQYMIRDPDGRGTSWHVGGSSEAHPHVSSQTSRGAHVYGSVTRGGRIFATASDSPPQSPTRSE